MSSPTRAAWSTRGPSARRCRRRAPRARAAPCARRRRATMTTRACAPISSRIRRATWRGRRWRAARTCSPSSSPARRRPSCGSTGRALRRTSMSSSGSRAWRAGCSRRSARARSTACACPASRSPPAAASRSAPRALRAPWWLTLLTLCLYGWRFYSMLSRAPLPSRWLVITVAFIGMLGVWMEYRTLFGRQPGVILLMLFSGLKLLESRHHRDGAVAAFLGYFLIVTNLLYTQSIPTALVMCAGVFMITATLVGFSAPQRAPRANLRTAELLLAHAAPAALALFVLFPRVQGPLWGLPQDAYAGMTGLSETMSPGNLSQLALSDAIAFRAAFEGESPPQPLRYWRGPVLWDFDGRTWSSGQGFLANFQPPEGGAARYQYSVVLEPHNHYWLFALETAASLPERSRMTQDGQVLSITPVRNRLRYDMTSV